MIGPTAYDVVAFLRKRGVKARRVSASLVVAGRADRWRIDHRRHGGRRRYRWFLWEHGTPDFFTPVGPITQKRDLIRMVRWIRSHP